MELVRETEIGRRIEALGRFDGWWEGRTVGRREGRRETVQDVLRIRFPELDIPGSALPRDEEQLSAILNLALTTSDVVAVRRQIGHFEGLAAGRRAAILDVLRIRFPELAIPESALPHGEEQLSSILNLALTSSDAAEVRRHILGH